MSFQESNSAISATEPIFAPAPGSSDILLDQARTAKREKRPADYKTACEAWLLSDRSICVGDTVKLHYSGEAREVLIEAFELHWPTGYDLDLPTLVFEGPTVQRKPRRVERASNWCSRSTLVRKADRRSAYLSSGLGDLSAA